MRDRLIELVKASVYGNIDDGFDGPVLNCENIADHLLANGVIVPPCKVGDMVYRHNIVVWDCECCNCEHYRVGGFGDPSECGATKDGFKHPDCIEITEETVTQTDILHYLCYNEFGKTVFLTKEDAERALKERRQV